MASRKLEMARFLFQDTIIVKFLRVEMNKFKRGIKENYPSLGNGFYKIFNNKLDLFIDEMAKLYASSFTYKELVYFRDYINSELGKTTFQKSILITQKCGLLGAKFYEEIYTLINNITIEKNMDG